MTKTRTVGAPEVVDDVGDDVDNHAHVVDGQIAVATDAEGAAHVGGADADGKDSIAVLRENPTDGAQFEIASIAVHKRG